MRGDNPFGKKKFRTYKGKRIERPETERERRERLIPGTDGLTALSRGIVEEEPEDTFDTEGELEDEGGFSRICFSIPDNWGELMTSDPTIQQSFKKRLKEGRELGSRDFPDQKVGKDLEQADDTSRGGFTRDEALEFMRRVRKAEERSGRTFLNDLKFVLEPLVDDHSIPADLVGGDDDGIMMKEQDSPIRFKGASRAQVVDACNRHGLRTLEQVLQLISHIQTATKGGLTANVPTPKAK